MNKAAFLILLFTAFCQLLLSQTAPLKYWVQFTDKDNSSFSISNPEEFMSEDGIENRAKFNIPFITEDLPVNQTYLDQLTTIEGVSLVHTSKWFNAATVQLADSSYMVTALPEIESLSVVQQIKSVEIYSNEIQAENSYTKAVSGTETIVNAYGASFPQIAIHDGHLLHELGFRGEGMKIGVFDSGFYGVHFLEGFSHLREEGRVTSERDIVDSDDIVYFGGSHGRQVLSIMAAYIPDSLIGSAYEADYYLFRTEDGDSEYIVEEDNWIRALEMADSMGIQVINSSLGYTQFNDTLQNHTYEDMDGNTTRISIAADKAASKGMLIVNSAGNSGDNAWNYIGAPADADSILAVGAVNSLGEYAWFSSRGPSSDGDVKPNVCGVGNQTVFANTNEGVSSGNGTSFSAPVISGLAACLWQAFPDKSNMEIIEAIEQSAHLYTNPNDSLGNGIPNFFNAYKALQSTLTVEPQILVFPNPVSDCTKIIIESDSVSRVFMTDVAGRIVVEIKSLAQGEKYHTLMLDNELLNLNAGVYFLNAVVSEDEVITARLIKE